MPISLNCRSDIRIRSARDCERARHTLRRVTTRISDHQTFVWTLAGARLPGCSRGGTTVSRHAFARPEALEQTTSAQRNVKLIHLSLRSSCGLLPLRTMRYTVWPALTRRGRPAHASPGTM